jgi:hypothetical protein
MSKIDRLHRVGTPLVRLVGTRREPPGPAPGGPAAAAARECRGRGDRPSARTQIFPAAADNTLKLDGLGLVAPWGEAGSPLRRARCGTTSGCSLIVSW